MLRGVLVLLSIIWSVILVNAQPGEIIETGDQVLDPNQDGFTSLTNVGFNQDGYDVDEFEYKMFGIPIFGDGEALNDVQSGKPCGVVDIALDTAGYGVYAGYDSNENLIFRFRLAGDQQSVQSYSIFMDTDQLVGTQDPNSSAVNPGFEIEITLIQRFGVYIYAIDGIDSCPTPIKSYDVDTNQQKSITGSQSCENEDIYMDFYVPFSDLEALFGITPSTNIRFAAVTNISATCALDGSISDIGGVDDVAYDGCFSCAILDLTENQCPSSVSNLCETCAGFPLGATATPSIDLPVIVGDLNISGTAESEAEVFIALYSSDDQLLDQDTIDADINGLWQSTDFVGALNFGDSVTVNALLPGKCESGALDTGLSFAIVSPNQPPVISGPGTTVGYIENSPPILIGEEVVVTDDNSTLLSATVMISQNYQDGLDFLELVPPGNLLVAYDTQTAILSITGEADLATYQTALRAITFYNISDAPSLDIRSISYQTFDGTNYSSEYSINLLITEQNDSPVIVIGSNPVDTVYVSTDEDVPLPFCIEAEDVDLDQLLITSTALSTGHGTIELDQGLCLIFQPELNYNGIEYIEITICDDGEPALCDTVIAAVQINPVNDAPEILQDNVVVDSVFYTIEQSSDLSFCLEGFDLENDDLIIESIELLTPNSSALEWQSDLCFLFTPQSNFIGIDKAEIIICDTGSPSRCTLLYVEINVEDTNLPPEITTTSLDTLYLEMFKNTTLEICLDAIDPDNDVLDFGPFSDLLGVGGSVDLTYNCLNYTSPENFVGIVLIDVSVCDDVTPAKCDKLILKIDVLPFNNPPQVILAEVPVDTVLFSTDVNVQLELCLDVIDPDNDNVSTSSVIKDSGDGTFISTDALCIEFVPEADSTGVTWATVTICDDGDPNECIETVIGVTVSPVNDPPEIKFNGTDVDTLYYETIKNTELAICLEAEDINNDNLRVEAIDEINPGGFYFPGDTELCLGFVPTTDFVGQALHQIIICDDGSPIGCDTVFVQVDILNLNTAPRLLYNNVQVDTINVSTIEDEPIELCVSAEDIDGDIVSVSELTLLSGEGSNAIAQNGSDYCLTYTPALGFFGDSYVGLKVCDSGTPEQCAYVVVHIEVINLNNAPEVFQIGIVTDTVRFSMLGRTTLSECIEAIDQDGDMLSLNLPDLSLSMGTVSAAQDLCFEYTPDDSFIGKDYFDFEICDNQDPSLCVNTVMEIDVLPFNNAPEVFQSGIVTDTVRFSVPGRTTLSECIVAGDKDDDMLSLNLPDLSLSMGTVSAAQDLCFEYTPDNSFLGKDYFDFEICDNQDPSLCVNTVMEINVYSENNQPRVFFEDNEISTANFSVLETNIIELSFDIQDDLIDNHSLGDTTLVSGSGNLSATLSDDRIYIDYTPDILSFGNHQISFTICDDGLPELCTTVTLDFEVGKEDIFPFEAISPNNDGMNDYWLIQGIEHYPNNSVRIFDRWNNLVFAMDGYDNMTNVWRGESNRGISNGDLNDGTYFYKISLAPGQSALSGSVVVKR